MNNLLLAASMEKPADTTVVRDDNNAFIVRGKYHSLHQYAAYPKRHSYLVAVKRGLREGAKNIRYLHVGI